MKSSHLKNSLKKITLTKSIRFFTLVFSLILILSSCKPDPSPPPSLNQNKKIEDMSYLSNFERELRGKTIKIDPSFDLYFDFSSTMKRGVTDKVYGKLIQDAFYKIEPSDNMYSIGENKVLKLITGSSVEKQNSVLGAVNYVQNMTYMTVNINNVVSHLQKPAVIFSDFSIDEGKPSRDMEGITSSFIRGPEYKKQFSTWLISGGSIRIYGKYIMEKGAKMPIYVIVFLPSGYYSSSHRFNNILDLFDKNLKADIFFDFHPNFVKFTSQPSDPKYLSDSLHFGKQSNGHFKLEKDLGELMISSSDDFMTNVTKHQKKVTTTLFHGLGWKDDNSSYLQGPTFTSKISEIDPLPKENLSTKLNDKPIGIFNPSLVTVGSIFQIPMNFNAARQQNNYTKSHLIRYSIQISGCSKKPRWDKDKAFSSLQYNLKSGGKTFLNTCLYQSIDEALEFASSNNTRLTTVYSIYTFIKKTDKK